MNAGLSICFCRQKWTGPTQYEDPTGQLMMLPLELSVIQDPQLRQFAELYAKDEAVFFADFTAAYNKVSIS